MNPLNRILIALGVIVLIGTLVVVPRLTPSEQVPGVAEVEKTLGPSASTESLAKLSPEELLNQAHAGRENLTRALGDLLHEKETAFLHADQLKQDLEQGRPPSIPMGKLVDELGQVKGKLNESREMARAAFEKYEAATTRLLLNAVQAGRSSKPVDLVALAGLLLSGTGLWMEWKKQKNEQAKLELEIKKLQKELN